MITLLSVFVLAFLAIQVVLDISPFDPPWGGQSAAGPQLKITVRGGPSSMVLWLAHRLRVADGDLWLAWSSSGLAFVHTVGDRLTVLWTATGGHRPWFDVENRTFRWSDSSNLQFQLSRWEQHRFRHSQGF